jgi:hypothetical protein
MAEVVWTVGGFSVPNGGGTNTSITEGDPKVDYTDLGPGGRLRRVYADVNTRYDMPCKIQTTFELSTKAWLDRLKIWEAKQKSLVLEVGLFDNVTAGPVLCMDTSYITYWGAFRPWKAGSVTVYHEGTEVAAADYTLTVAQGKIVFDGAQHSTDAITAKYIWQPTCYIDWVHPVIAGPDSWDVTVLFSEVR